MLRTRTWRWVLRSVAVLVATALAGVLPAGMAEEEAVDVETTLAAFSEAWPTHRKEYRRANDDSWKAYARTLRAVVAAGDASALRLGLQHGNRQVRALCARALGYLADRASVGALAEVLADDDWPTVRLLAADSLGVIATSAAKEALVAAQGEEEEADVRLHITIALGREEALGEGYRAALLALEETDLDSARVGKPAPPFSLETSAGETVSLASFRGKKRVVLVFLYGDG